MSDDHQKSAIDRLLQIMARLRDPETGCPWDTAQDFKSIAPYTIEEAYEVADAIDHEDMDHLKEELGDLLLQVVFHARMAEELGHFDFWDVVQGIADKMIQRHPHVFGDEKTDSAADVTDIWESQKDQERTGHTSALDGVALGLPALLRAKKLQARAARAGFEWPDLDSAWDKFEEELSELKDAINDGSKAPIVEELGDVLFCLVNYARMREIESEGALRGANAKFEKRFKGMEDDLKEEDLDMKDVDLQRLLEIWAQQKKFVV